MHAIIEISYSLYLLDVFKWVEYFRNVILSVDTRHASLIMRIWKVGCASAEILSYDTFYCVGDKRDDDEDLIVSSETYLAMTPSYMKSENQNARPPVPEKSTSRRRSISCKRLVNRRCSTPLRELSPACVNSKAIVPYVSRKVLNMFNTRLVVYFASMTGKCCGEIGEMWSSGCV